MTELRAQVNMRIDADTNISISTTTLSDNPDEARKAGRGAAEIIQAWLEGYAAGLSEIGEEQA